MADNSPFQIGVDLIHRYSAAIISAFEYFGECMRGEEIRCEDEEAGRTPEVNKKGKKANYGHKNIQGY